MHVEDSLFISNGFFFFVEVLFVFLFFLMHHQSTIFWNQTLVQKIWQIGQLKSMHFLARFVVLDNFALFNHTYFVFMLIQKCIEPNLSVCPPLIVNCQLLQGVWFQLLTKSLTFDIWRVQLQVYIILQCLWFNLYFQGRACLFLFCLFYCYFLSMEWLCSDFECWGENIHEMLRFSCLFRWSGAQSWGMISAL